MSNVVNGLVMYSRNGWAHAGTLSRTIGPVSDEIVDAICVEMRVGGDVGKARKARG
jgi:hypothetical protein